MQNLYHNTYVGKKHRDGGQEVKSTSWCMYIYIKGDKKSKLIFESSVKFSNFDFKPVK